MYGPYRSGLGRVACIYMRSTQIRFIDYMDATEYELCKMKITQTENCAHCNQQETVQHLREREK